MAAGSVLAKRLKEARLRAGISQKVLGIEAGIDRFAASTRINYYELGKTHPPYPTAERLAKVLKVPTPYLYARDDEMAAWILAYDELGPAVRRSITRRARPK